MRFPIRSLALAACGAITLGTGSLVTSGVPTVGATSPVGTVVDELDAEPADTDVPATDPPATESPSTEPPSTESPSTDQPATDSSGTVLSDDPDDEREDSVSIWWWVLGGVAAAAAVYGIIYSVRRRDADEEWARRAATMCDTGRAVAATLTGHLTDDATWAPPERFAHQLDRFSGMLDRLATNAPNDDFRTLLTDLASERDDLVATTTAIAPRTATDVARDELAPIMTRLDASLSAIEHEASLTIYGAALPTSQSSR